MKVTPLKRKSRSPERKAMHECDALWAQIIKALADGKCEFCRKEGAEAHHMVLRAKSRLLRHSIQNGVYVCKSCHFRFHNKESLFLWKWLEENRADDYSFLLAHMNGTTKEKYTDVKERLKALLQVTLEQAA